MNACFFSTVLFQTFLIQRRCERDMIKNVRWSYVKYQYSCQAKIKLDFFRQILEKYSNIELRTSDHWEPICSKRTDGQTDVTKLSRFL